MKYFLISFVFIVGCAHAYPISIKTQKEYCEKACELESPTGVWYGSEYAACICNDRGLDNILEKFGGCFYENK